jgi:hypothetical protein
VLLGTLDELYPRTPVLPPSSCGRTWRWRRRGPLTLSDELAAAFWVPLAHFAAPGVSADLGRAGARARRSRCRALAPKLLAFAGPGYLVAVGYMDPGNWATDLAGGSRFGYTLLSVILLSNLMAVLLQGLASKLGIVTGRDLAQACRDHYSRPVSFVLWVLCEIAIAACDLAEVIGTAIALNLLFGIPLPGASSSRRSTCCSCSAAEQGVPAARGARHRARGDGRRCFLFELIVSRPDMAAWRAASSRRPTSCATARSSTSRSASSARR